MKNNLLVHSRGSKPLSEFLLDNDFEVDEITDFVMKITRGGDLPIFIHIKEQGLYFEADLGSIKNIASQALFQALLDINSEILPVSVGINSTNPVDPRLVLLESREAQNLDENELLSVINALELATDKVETILSDHI